MYKKMLSYNTQKRREIHTVIYLLSMVPNNQVRGVKSKKLSLFDVSDKRQSSLG